MTLKTMIVDDEPFVRADLRHMLCAHANLEVICEAGTISEAKKQLRENDLDVVFLDIQLRGGTGFDLVPLIDESAKIIFITAHDEFAIRAFEINALDYILKPVTASRLAKSIERLTPDKTEKKTDADAPGPLNQDDQVFVKTESGRLFIHLAEIAAISSFGGNYTHLHLKNEHTYVCRKTFKVWENILPPSGFIRIHRSAIVNKNFIESITSSRDGSCLVTLSGQRAPFAVSRRMVKKIKELANDLSV